MEAHVVGVACFSQSCFQRLSVFLRVTQATAILEKDSCVDALRSEEISLGRIASCSIDCGMFPASLVDVAAGTQKWVTRRIAEVSGTVTSAYVRTCVLRWPL